MKNAFRLDHKKILITGASSGIGREIAISCAAYGADIIITARDEKRLQETLDLAFTTNKQMFTAELTDEEQVKQLISKIDQVDGWVHCAGVVRPYPIRFLNEKKINETMNANFNSAVHVMAALAAQKKLNKNASVVLMSSISGQHPHKGNALYAASKASIEVFSKCIALEFYAQGIRSNSISPAMIKTPMYDEAEEKMSKEAMDEHVAKYPLGVGYPDDVANAAVFFLSEASRWITGINITLDGGLLLEK